MTSLQTLLGHAITEKLSNYQHQLVATKVNASDHAAAVPVITTESPRSARMSNIYDQLQELQTTNVILGLELTFMSKLLKGMQGVDVQIGQLTEAQKQLAAVLDGLLQQLQAAMNAQEIKAVPAMIKDDWLWTIEEITTSNHLPQPGVYNLLECYISILSKLHVQKKVILRYMGLILQSYAAIYSPSHSCSI